MRLACWFSRAISVGMATAIMEVYDALREAGASEDTSRKAAEAIAISEGRLGKFEADVGLLKWMVGFNIAVTPGGFGLLARMVH